jgi:hypothetical protein
MFSENLTKNDFSTLSSILHWVILSSAFFYVQFFYVPSFYIGHSAVLRVMLYVQSFYLGLVSFYVHSFYVRLFYVPSFHLQSFST